MGGVCPLKVNLSVPPTHATTVPGYLLEKSGFVAARMSGPSAPAAQL